MLLSYADADDIFFRRDAACDASLLLTLRCKLAAAIVAAIDADAADMLRHAPCFRRCWRDMLMRCRLLLR